MSTTSPLAPFRPAVGAWLRPRCAVLCGGEALSPRPVLSRVLRPAAVLPTAFLRRHRRCRWALKLRYTGIISRSDGGAGDGETLGASSAAIAEAVTPAAVSTAISAPPARTTERRRAPTGHQQQRRQRQQQCTAGVATPTAVSIIIPTSSPEAAEVAIPAAAETELLPPLLPPQ